MRCLTTQHVVAVMIALGALTGCGSGADAPNPEDEGDESWGESSLGGKADGASSEDTIAERKAFTAQFDEPALSTAEEQELLARYSNIDPDGEAPRDLLEPALVYYDTNRALLENVRYLTLIDFSEHSSKRRMFIIDMESGSLERHVVAHGSGSDPDNTGRPTIFSNVQNSHKSSLGFYVTAETYSGKYGTALKLDGLSETNSNVRERSIVLHGSNYVADGRAKQGRSWGCPAVPMTEKGEIIDMVKGGSLMYAEQSAE